MTVEKVRDLYNAQPFVPLVPHLAASRAIAVHHREFMLVAPSGRTIVVQQPDDSINIIDLLLVTDLELRPGGNGSKSKKKMR